MSPLRSPDYVHCLMQSNVQTQATSALPGARVLGARINALGWRETLDVLAGWVARRESRYVCISNVHMVMTAREDKGLAEAMSASDMATPDGAPVAWMLRRLGFADQPRISGMELMLACLKEAAARGVATY